MTRQSWIGVGLLLTACGVGYVWHGLTEPDQPSRALVGTLDSVELASGRIILLTKGRRLYLDVHPGTRIHSGPRAIALRDLAHHTNEPVKVWINDNGTVMVATDVRLAAPAP